MVTGSDYPNQVPVPLLSQHYKAYAKEFGLYEIIIFNVSVASLKSDYEKAKWLV
jgi:hypothetical protein